MPELTPQQKAQLDKNIKAMLSQGASEEDVISYATDFRARFDVKKKVSIADVGMAARGGGEVGVSKAPSGLTVTGYETDLDRSIQERQRQATQINFDENDPIKSALLPIENKIAERRNRQVSSSTATPISRLSESFANKELASEKSVIENSRFRDVKEAELFLFGKLDKSKLVPKQPLDITKEPTLDDFTEESVVEASPKDNLTVQKAASQYFTNKEIREDIGSSASLDEAAIKNAIRKGDVTSKQITELGGDIPNQMKGLLVLNFLNNPDVREEANKNPELMNKVRQELFDLPEKYPLAAIRMIAEKVSNKMEQRGDNNAILNIKSKNSTDNIVNELIETGELPVQYKYLYDNPAVKLAVNSSLKTSGFVENLLTSAEQGLMGIGKTVAEVTGLRSVYSDKNERTFKALEKQYSDFAFKPKNWVHEISTHGGLVTGQVLPMMAGGGLIKAAGLVNSTKAANAIMAGLQTFGENKDRALVDLPGESGAKQLGYATVLTGVEIALANVLDDTKLAKSLMKGVSPEIKTVVTKFANKEITAAAAKKSVIDLFSNALSKSGTFVKGTANVANKEAWEEAVTEILQATTNQVFSGQPIELSQSAEDAFEVWRTTFLGSLFLGIGGGVVDVNKNPSVPKLIYEMAENPDKYIDIIEGQAAIDENYSKDVKQKIANLEYISKVKQDLDATEMSKRDKEKFLLASLNQKILSDQAESITEPTLKKKPEEKIKELEAVKQDILENPTKEEISQPIELDPNLPEGYALPNQPTIDQDRVLGDEDVELTPEQKILQQAIDNNEIVGIYLDIAKASVNDPKEAKLLLDDAKSQIEGQVAGELGTAREGVEKAFGKSIVDFVLPKAEAGSVGVGGDVDKPINWSKERLDKEIEKLDPYESQGYGVTRNQSLKESMVDFPDKARLAFELRDFFKRMYKKDFEKDFDKRPLSSLSQFFYTDAKSLKDWVDNQIEGINNSIKSNQEYIDGLSNSKSDTKSKEMWADTIEKSKNEIERLKAEYENYEKEKVVIDKKGDNVEISSKNSINEQNKEATDFGKVISASSRFRPAETVVFDKPIIGKNGNKLISYQWAYEWTMQPSGKDSELKSKRVSDWTQAENSAETGRDIVHKFTVERKDGTVVTVSSETIPSLLGYVDAAEMKNLPSVVSSVKTLAKQRMQLAILKAQESEYNNIKQEVEKGSKPNITVATKEELPFVTRKMIDSGRLDPNDFTYFKMGDETYRQDGNSKNPTKETIEQLTDSWVKKEVENKGGKKPSGLYDLERRIERQEKKVEQATGSKLKAVEQSLKEQPKAEAKTPKPKEQTPVSETPKPQAKELADKVRKLKIDLSKLSDGGLQSNPLGLPVAVWNGAMDIIAKTIEAGGQVADAIKRGLNYIQKNHRGQWDKKGFNDQVMKELGVRGITVNGEDLVVKDVDKEFAETINGFYSDLEQTILEVSPTDKGTPQAWLKKIGTGDEAKWTGVTDWLNSLPKDQKVTRKEILDWLKENRIQVVEVVKTELRDIDDNPKPLFDSGELILEKKVDDGVKYVYPFNVVTKSGEYIQEVKSLDDAINNPSVRNEARSINKRIAGTGRTKFSQYQLEGEKSNYKEVLVTLPRKKTGVEKAVEKELNDLFSIPSEKRTDEQRDRIGELQDKIQSQPSSVFKSSHFDEPNILVHLRMNTRTDAEGKKVLFLEEIQSDWSREGRDKGFSGDYDIRLDPKYDMYVAYDKNGNKIPLWYKGESVQALNSKERVIEALKDSPSSPKTPKAPFVTDTSSYVRLGLKVALKEAVKQGEQLQRAAFEKLVNEKMDWVEARMKKLGKLEVKCP